MIALEACVLIADDEPAIAAILERTVNRMGFTAVVVSDGVQLLEMARTLGLSLVCVICDVKMPFTSGLDAAIAIREFAPTVPIMFMSGSDYRSFSYYAIMMPQVTILEKPFALKYVRSLLNELLPVKEYEA